MGNEQTIVKTRTEYDPGADTYSMTLFYRNGTQETREATAEEALAYQTIIRQCNDGVVDVW